MRPRAGVVLKANPHRVVGSAAVRIRTDAKWNAGPVDARAEFAMKLVGHRGQRYESPI
jgi:hypothetical protein